jgi:hypothetical protein
VFPGDLWEALHDLTAAPDPLDRPVRAIGPGPGHRLENNKVDDATRAVIVEEPHGTNIHVGRRAWQIRHGLERGGS